MTSLKSFSASSLPPLFSHPKNSDISRFLTDKNPSAHSDVSSEMILAAKGLRGVHSYAPDPRRYSYELLHTDDGIIFCVAVGQSTLLFRIPTPFRDKSLGSKGQPFPPLGSDWIAIDAFAADCPLAEWRQLLKKLCKTALGSSV